jgi:hypothetical protein
MIGLVERFHRSWKDGVATFMASNAQNDWNLWVKLLCRVQFGAAFNCSIAAQRTDDEQEAACAQRTATTDGGDGGGRANAVPRATAAGIGAESRVCRSGPSDGAGEAGTVLQKTSASKADVWSW